MKSAKKRHHIKEILLERFLNDAVACAFERQNKRISIPRAVHLVDKAQEINDTDYNLDDDAKNNNEYYSKNQHVVETKPSLSLSGFLSKIKKSDPQVVVRRREHPSNEAVFEEDIFAGKPAGESIERAINLIEPDPMETAVPKSHTSNHETVIQSIPMTERQESTQAIEPFFLFSEDSFESMMGPR